MCATCTETKSATKHHLLMNTLCATEDETSCNIRNIMHNEVMSKTYNMDNELVDEIVNEMHEGEMMCSIDEIVEACCGNNFYGNWDDEELKYVEEVMREYCQINVEFDLENELMIIASAVDE